MSEGGEARNHEAEVEAVARALAPWVTGRHGARMAARAALDALRRSLAEFSDASKGQ